MKTEYIKPILEDCLKNDNTVITVYTNLKFNEHASENKKQNEDSGCKSFTGYIRKESYLVNSEILCMYASDSKNTYYIPFENIVFIQKKV